MVRASFCGRMTPTSDVGRLSFRRRMTPTLVGDLDTHFENPRIWAADPRLDLGWEVRYDRALLEHDCNAEADLSA